MIIVGLTATVAGFVAVRRNRPSASSRLSALTLMALSIRAPDRTTLPGKGTRDGEPEANRRARSMVKRLSHSVVRTPQDFRRLVLIFGCHRSGTMLLQQTILDRSGRVSILGEHDRRLVRPCRQENERQDDVVVLSCIGRLPFEVVAVKPLVESYRVAQLLRSGRRAHGIWMLRHYLDVALSNLVRFGVDNAHQDLKPFLADVSQGWRCRGATDETAGDGQSATRPGAPATRLSRRPLRVDSKPALFRPGPGQRRR